MIVGDGVCVGVGVREGVQVCDGDVDGVPVDVAPPDTEAEAEAVNDAVMLRVLEDEAVNEDDAVWVWD